MARLFPFFLLLCACAAKDDPALDVCQVNVDCMLVQQDACCSPSECDADIHAETNARTRQRLARCASKDCEKRAPGCKATHPKVASFCREGKCVVERQQ